MKSADITLFTFYLDVSIRTQGLATLTMVSERSTLKTCCKIEIHNTKYNLNHVDKQRSQQCVDNVMEVPCVSFTNVQYVDDVMEVLCVSISTWEIVRSSLTSATNTPSKVDFMIWPISLERSLLVHQITMLAVQICQRNMNSYYI